MLPSAVGMSLPQRWEAAASVLGGAQHQGFRVAPMMIELSFSGSAMCLLQK